MIVTLKDATPAKKIESEKARSLEDVNDTIVLLQSLRDTSQCSLEEVRLQRGILR